MQLNSAQETFLSELFALCARYQRTAGVDALTQGIQDGVYAVRIEIRKSFRTSDPCVDLALQNLDTFEATDKLLMVEDGLT